ncbi:MAG: hypothetical protein JSS94_04175 [Bacteroidetes bacterium]|nr:hypothetical protein [Bacteroidota bacterium]
MKTNSTENLRFFPIHLSIEFLRVPKQGSLDCDRGLGFCFKITITFGLEDGTIEKPTTFYNTETGKIGGWGAIDLDDRNNMLIHFPDEISRSSYHSEKDLENFLVLEDKEYGDVTFIEGEYRREENNDGQYNYNIKIQTK